jgi:small-conductance mechanosensitive channel
LLLESDNSPWTKGPKPPSVFDVATRVTINPKNTQNKMQIIDTIIGILKKVTELGVALLALTVVLQVVFGTPVPFIKLDVVGNLTGLIATLGSSGLVGLIAAGVLYAVLSKK